MKPRDYLHMALWLGGCLFSQSAEEKYWTGMLIGFLGPIAVAWFVSNLEN